MDNYVPVDRNVSNSGFMFHLSQTSGYLNLLANCIDNFTHGLAVAGSFLVSKKVRSCDNFNTKICFHQWAYPHDFTLCNI